MIDPIWGSVVALWGDEVMNKYEITLFDSLKGLQDIGRICRLIQDPKLTY